MGTYRSKTCLKFSPLDWKALSIILCLLCSTFFAQAQTLDPELSLQDTSQVHVLETKRGDRFIGRVIDIENTTISFQFLQDQVLKFQIAEIERIDVQSARGASSAFNPRFLSIVPTAFNLRKGEYEYQNVDILWNNLNYGISDRVSIGGGSVIPFALLLNAKWSITSQAKGLNLALNLQNVIPLLEGGSPVSFMTGVASIGTTAQFINGGAGLAFTYESGSEVLPYVFIGGATPISNKFYLYGSINAVNIDDELLVYPTFSGNIYLKRSRLSFGLGFDLVEEVVGLYLLPLLSYSQRF